MRYHDIHCRLNDREFQRLRDMVNGGAISSFIRRQIFLGTDWSRVQEIKNEIQKIRTELVRAGALGIIEDALRENSEKMDELDRKLDQLIYLQKAAQTPEGVLQGSEDAHEYEKALQGSEEVLQGFEAPLQKAEEKRGENNGNNKDH